jgi:hypothetical protein
LYATLVVIVFADRTRGSFEAINTSNAATALAPILFMQSLELSRLVENPTSQNEPDLMKVSLRMLDFDCGWGYSSTNNTVKTNTWIAILLCCVADNASGRFCELFACVIIRY